MNTFQAAEAVIEDAFRENQTLSHNMLVLTTTLAQSRRPRMRLIAIHQLQAMTPTERDIFMASTPIPSDMVAALNEPVTVEPLPSAEAPALTLEHYKAAIERVVESTAQQRDYSGAVACASYASSTNPMWAAEAAAFVAWRDAVWAYVFTELAAAQTSEEVPSIEDVLTGLPVMTWPEV